MESFWLLQFPSFQGNQIPYEMQLFETGREALFEAFPKHYEFYELNLIH